MDKILPSKCAFINKVMALTLNPNVMSSDLSKLNSKNKCSVFENETSLMTSEKFIITHSFFSLWLIHLIWKIVFVLLSWYQLTPLCFKYKERMNSSSRDEQIWNLFWTGCVDNGKKCWKSLLDNRSDAQNNNFKGR